MPGQYRIKRRVALLNIAAAENTIQTVDLPRGYDLESIYFVLNGGGTLSGAGSAVRAEAPMHLIKRIEVIADGKNTIASVSGLLLRSGTYNRRGQLGLLSAPAAATATAQTFSAGFVLDQQLIDGVRPKDSNLRTSGMQLLQLRITFGAYIDLFTGSPAGGLTGGNTLDIMTSEIVELQDENGQISRPLYVLKRTYQDIAVPTTNSNQEVSLPVGNFLRSVTLRAEGAVTAGEASDSVLNFLTLRSGVDVRLSASALALIRSNQVDFQITNRPAGYYVADLMSSGQVVGVKGTDAWDLTRASECKAVLDVTGATNAKISIMTTELVQ